MSMPSDMTADITEAVEAEARFPGERLVDQFSPQQRGWAAAALVAFVGVAYLGPLVTRVLTPKSRTQKLKDEAAYRAAYLRRRAGKAGQQARKKARRLGGGTIRR